MTRSKFYGNAYLFLAAGLFIVFWGFSRSYFGRLNQLSSAYHVHGISATLWMLLLIIQPYLYKINQLKIHRYLGWSTLILVPTITVAGFEMMQLMIRGQENYPPNTVYQLAFIDAVTLIGFVGLYSLGIYYRKNLKLHARFMVCTIFGPLLPALTRVFFSLRLADSFNESLTISYLLIEVVLLAIIWRERKSKAIRYTYFPVLLFTIAQHLLMYSVNNWGWWVNLMNQIAGFA